MDADRFFTYSLKNPRLTSILAAAIEAVEPGRIVRHSLEKNKLPPHNRLFLLGVGKAAESMTLATAAIYEDFTDALIITKHSFNTINDNISRQILGRVKILEAGHPVPDKRSLAAGQAILEFISHIQENDLLICLISGGGSALMVVPRKGLSLADIQILTSSMLNSGASIDELNVIRSQLDRLKGGGLAGATKGKILSLILSDVMGDHLETIASGLTVPDPTIIEKIPTIVEKYDIAKLVSNSKLKIITRGKIFDYPILDRVNNIIVANNTLAIQAAKEKAVIEGFFTEIINPNIQGEASIAGKQMAETLQIAMNQKPLPFCLISGGETTVTIRGNGKGGRNQELALGAVEILDNLNNAMLVSLATDGDDGPTEAAGAVVNGNTNQRAQKLGMSAADYLSKNDAYSYFEALGDLLRPGYTGTNVNDLIFLFGF